MADEERPFYLRTYLYKCFYFCPAFYDAYKNHSNWKNIYARIHNNEAIFLCLDCIEKMRNYISEDKPYFFYETKKLLIEYYIPIGESTRRLKIERSVWNNVWQFLLLFEIYTE